MTEKQRFAKWEDFVKMIFSSTTIIEDEPMAVRQARIARLEAEPEEWFRYYFPRFAYAPAACFHKEATGRVLANREWYEVRLWSRELAKSTRTMMEVFYLVFVGHPALNKAEITEQDAEEHKPQELKHIMNRKGRLQKRYVLLISNSLDNAERLLMPYKANLECNRRMIQDYGLQQSPGQWQSAAFTTQGGIAFRALGVGQSPRGSRNEEVRPDIILFDDVDTDMDCMNPELVAKKWRWIEEAAIGTRSVSMPTTIIFCGNRIGLNCCIDRAAALADHTHTVNIRNADGASSWPEKNTEADIDRVLRQKSYAAQQKEYFNNPVTEGSVFKEMSYKPALPLKAYSMLVCYTDPSYKHTNDYKATVLVGKTGYEFHVIKCFLEQATTAAMISWHLIIMELAARSNCSCYYFMEEVFMQDVLLKEVSDAGKRIGRPIPIRGDKRQKPDKFMRIESLLEPLNRNGELYLNQEERHNPHMERLAAQFTAFAPGSRAHDDGPDAVEGAIWLINQKLGQRNGEGIEVFGRAINNNRL